MPKRKSFDDYYAQRKSRDKRLGFHVNRQHGPRYGLGYEVIERNGRRYHIYDIPGGGRDVIGMKPQKTKSPSLGATTDPPVRGKPRPASLGKMPEGLERMMTKYHGTTDPHKQAIKRGAYKKPPKL